MSNVAVLFARANSIYKSMANTDVWDIERDARKWGGGSPIVAHPPCRAWGRLSHMAKPRYDEKALATWSIDKIRQYGGVLEHPASSKLWLEYMLPEPNQIDEFGGYTLVVSQWWWGHKALKNTRLYICGVKPADLPVIPYLMGTPDFVIASSIRGGKSAGKHWCSMAEREMTPPLFAQWLVDVAKLCRVEIKASE